MQVEQWAEIRRLSHVEGLSQREIARRLHCCTRTVKKALALEQPPGKATRPRRASLLDPYRAKIEALIAKYPRLSAVRILEEIRKGPEGYRGQITQLRQYLREIRPSSGRVYQEVHYDPGQAMQVDWGHCGSIRIGKTSRSISVFVAVLCYSRLSYIEFCLSQHKAEFYRALVHALEFYGGSPRQIIFDNLKAAVLNGSGRRACLHPEFLADQLAASLDRLGLATVDVCLLHNPEYFLLDAQHRSRPLEETRREFDRRLGQAFRYLEEQVRQGRIRYHGVSSNTVIGPAESPETTSLSRILEIADTAAREAGQASSHFQVLQCPLNLFESGAVFLPNTGLGGGQTVLDHATAKGIAVLANRPLNAMPTRPESRGGIVRLAEVPVEAESIDFAAQQATVAALEATYQRELAPHVPHAGQGLDPKEYFTWSVELAKIRPHLDGLEHWEQVEHQMVAGRQAVVLDERAVARGLRHSPHSVASSDRGPPRSRCSHR